MRIVPFCMVCLISVMFSCCIFRLCVFSPSHSLTWFHFQNCLQLDHSSSLYFSVWFLGQSCHPILFCLCSLFWVYSFKFCFYTSPVSWIFGSISSWKKTSLTIVGTISKTFCVWQIFFLFLTINLQLENHFIPLKWFQIIKGRAEHGSCMHFLKFPPQMTESVFY